MKCVRLIKKFSRSSPLNACTVCYGPDGLASLLVSLYLYIHVLKLYSSIKHYIIMYTLQQLLLCTIKNGRVVYYQPHTSIYIDINDLLDHRTYQFKLCISPMRGIEPCNLKISIIGLNYQLVNTDSYSGNKKRIQPRLLFLREAPFLIAIAMNRSLESCC